MKTRRLSHISEDITRVSKSISEYITTHENTMDSEEVSAMKTELLQLLTEHYEKSNNKIVVRSLVAIILAITAMTAGLIALITGFIISHHK